MNSRILGSFLSRQGHDVVDLSCGGFALPACPAIDFRLGDVGMKKVDRESVCRECGKLRDALNNGNSEVLDKYIEKGDLISAEEIAKRILTTDGSKLPEDESRWLRNASYEISIKYKRSDQFVSKEIEPELLMALSVCILGDIAVSRFIERNAMFDCVIINNSLRGLNRTIFQKFESSGVRIVFINAGANIAHQLKQLMIFGSETASLDWANSEGWKKFCHKKMGIPGVSIITEHFRALFMARSNFVYSISQGSDSSEQLFKKLNLVPGKKTLLATLASADERTSAAAVGALDFLKDQGYLFDNQSDWLKFLIQEFRKRSNLQLIIRVHPREFPNKRENVRSQHADELLKVLSDLPDNVVVNWPTDEISFYDLVQIIDVGLVSTSTTGLQLVTLGIPIGIHNVGLLTGYPVDLGTGIVTKLEYQLFLDSCHNLEWSSENVLMGLKWHSYLFRCLSIDLSVQGNTESSQQKGRANFRKTKLPDVRDLLPLRLKKLLWYSRLMSPIINQIERRRAIKRVDFAAINESDAQRVLAVIEHAQADLGSTLDTDLFNQHCVGSESAVREFLSEIYELVSDKDDQGLLTVKIRKYLQQTT